LRAPGCLQYSPWLPPFGDPALTLTLLYSSTVTSTARSARGATLRAKQLLCVAAVFATIGTGVTFGFASPPFGFASPPTPEPIQMEMARSKPGGFLQSPFQVIGCKLVLLGAFGCTGPQPVLGRSLTDPLPVLDRSLKRIDQGSVKDRLKTGQGSAKARLSSGKPKCHQQNPITTKSIHQLWLRSANFAFPVGALDSAGLLTVCPSRLGAWTNL
jgi:hypothetical protein